MKFRNKIKSEQAKTYRLTEVIVLAILLILVLLVACQEPLIQPNQPVPVTTPVTPTPPIDTDTTPVTKPVELLVNSDFNSPEDSPIAWTNCGESQNYIINASNNGSLVVSDTACVYQTVPAMENTNYRLSCSLKSSAVYSSIALSTLDQDLNTLQKKILSISSRDFQVWELELLSNPNTKFVAVTLYSEGTNPSIYQFCSLKVATDSVDPIDPVNPTPSTTGTLKISGNLYLDSNRNGTFDTNETPIMNGQINLYSDVNSNGLKDEEDILRARAISEADGYYAFNELAEDVYLLDIPTIAPMDSYRLVAPSLVSIILSEEQNQINNHFGFVEYNGQSIFGHIYHDVNKNSYFDEGDTGISNVKVELYDDTNRNGLKDASEPLVASHTTASSGAYSFESLAEGIYALHIPPQYAQEEVSAPILPTGFNPALGAFIEKGLGAQSIQIKERTVIEYNDFGYITYTGPSISGKLYVDINRDGSFETDESVLAGVGLELYNDTNTNGVLDRGDTLETTLQTDTEGNYSFEDLDPALYVINLAATNPTLDKYELEEIPLFSLQLVERANVTNNDFKYIPTPPVAPSPSNVDFWPPNPNTTWQVQLARGLQNPVDTTIDAEVYDIDIDSRQSIINDLHNSGKKVICYISGGTAEAFRPAVQRTFGGNLYNDPALLEKWRSEGVIGNTYGYNQFENEFWMNPDSPIVRTYLTNLLDTCQAKGFDGVDIDNMDGFLWDKYAPEENKTGFDISRETQVEFINWLGQEALDRGLLYGLKNTSEMTESVHENASWAFLESCYSERLRGFTPNCNPYFEYFTNVGKSAYLNEYASVIDPLSEEVNQTPTEIRQQYCEWAAEDKIFLMFRINDDEIERRLCP